jgi:predicted ATPase
MTLLKSITIPEKYKNMVSKSFVEFQSGLNLLIGPNGSGKSTLLNIIQEYKNDRTVLDLEPGPYYFFDFEKHNPRLKSYIDNGFDIVSRMKSHGEVNRSVISEMSEAKDCLFIMDEPEQALDVDGIIELLDIVRKSKASQIIMVTHSPLIILSGLFHIVELEDGYYDKHIEAVRRVGKL